MASFRLKTFGGLAIERNDASATPLGAQRKALALLAVVTAAAPAGVPRERPAALLGMSPPRRLQYDARAAVARAAHG